MRTRPVRVAYLVGDDADAHEALSAAFAECYGRWGGRNTLIVPVKDGAIDAAYLSWLTWLDPDVVYTYADISAETTETIDRRLGPLLLRRHRHRGIDGRRDFRPHLELGFLSSLSTLPRAGLLQRLGRRIPIALLDAYPAWRGDPFVEDSFGLWQRCGYGWPMHDAAREFATSLALTPPDAPENRWRWSSLPDAEVTSEADVLRRMAQDAGIVTLAQLSGIEAPPPIDWHIHRWGEAFSLVVGDSFADRVCFWNSRLHHPAWRAGQFTALRVPEARLEDATFLEALTAFLRHRNSVGPDGSSGQGATAIRSASVPADRLGGLHERLRTGTYGWVRVEAISSIADCVPTAERLGKAPHDTPDTATGSASYRDFTATMPMPGHLTSDRIVPAALADGRWMVDVRLDRHDTQSRYGNDRHWWRLPRNRALARRFVQEEPCRIDRTGRLVLVAEAAGLQTPLRLPSDRGAMNALFQWWPPPFRDDLREREMGPGDSTGTRLSDKGRYLTGVLGLFGSLGSAHQVLENGYWQRTFLEMSSPARATDEATLTAIAAKLRARMGVRHASERLMLEGEDPWKRLAEAAARIAPRLRAPRPVRGYDHLLKAWRADVQRAIEGHAHLQEHREEIEKEAQGHLQEALERRCDEAVLAQGHRWICPDCAHDNWVSVDDVRRMLECRVCGHQRPLPPDFRWDFHLNDFLAEGLREHGMLGLVWVLGELQDFVRTSFFFTPPIELLEDIGTTERAVQEVDVCCVREGRFIIGEVKESARTFDERVVTGLADLAVKVRADVVVLACLDPAGRGKLDGLANTIRPRLDPVGCEVQVLVPGSDFGGPSIHLP